MYKTQAGQPFPQHLMEGAKKELDGLAAILEAEGVTVRRPEVTEGDFAQPIKTPDFESKSGLYAAMPRDVLITIGNQIIEAPMAWRSRWFEYRPYRALLKEYFHKGGMWTAAPKPTMSDELYVSEDEYTEGVGQYVTTEFEPVFDAAEFTRFGRDIFVQRSQVTNDFGIEWMRRHLGDDYNVHVLDFQDKNAMHIDGTFVPLGPGKLLICPKRPCVTGETHTWFTFNGEQKEYKLPEMFKGWDVFVAPTPSLPDTHPLFFTSPWTASCNVLLLDTERVIVEGNEPGVIQAFKDWGFKPIPVPFRHFLPFGGSFHCATCDVRRTGELQSYF
jgi:glycine amidinotransferase